MNTRPTPPSVKSWMPTPASLLYSIKAGFSGERRDRIGRRICYNDGKRVSCGGPKKPLKEKPGKKTVDEAYTEVQAKLAKGGRASAADVQEFAQSLLGMTVNQLNELKRRLQIKASGKKVELANRIAERALSGAKAKRKPPAGGPKKPQVDKGKEQAHDTLMNILGEHANGVDLGDREAVRQALKRALAEVRENAEQQAAGGAGAGAGGGGAGGADAEAGRRVEGEAGAAGGEAADRGGDAGGKSPHQRAVERVPAQVEEVNRRIDRFEKFFRAKGQHNVADWMGKLRDHVGAVGVADALASLGPESEGGGHIEGDVQYWGVGTDEANWKNMGWWMEQYLARNGIVAVTGDTSSPDLPMVSALGKPDRFVADQDFKPEGLHFKNKLDEAKTLPGLEKSEDISKVMDKPVTHLDDEVIAKLDQDYGPGKWIVKCYDDNAAAGYGIFFPQRAGAIRREACDTIWNAGSNLAGYGFQLKRDEKGKVVGLKHEGGDEYDFGTDKYQNTIQGDARHWADRAAAAAHHEKGAMLPEGSFMVQPAFEAVGISDAERAAGKTWHEKNEGRVHLVTRPDGSVEVVPHSTWLKGGNLPVVFEDDDTRAMAKAAKEAIEKIPHEARKGQVYAPDIMKTRDGYKVVELNAQGDNNGSGYLHDNHFTIDAYTSYLAGRQPAHVAFIRRLLMTQKKGGE